MIKIGDVKGYTIFYGANDKLFRLCDAEGNEVGSAPTQQALEDKADNLCKQAFPVPISALQASFGFLHRGRVTSVNIDTEECWFVYEAKPGRRTKMLLRSGELYELTVANEVVAQQVEEHFNRIEALRTEIRNLIMLLEKPINPQYFGIK